MASPKVDVVFFDHLEQIPPFNPDRESDGDTGTVANLQTKVRQAAVVLFSTPEYAHGIPGVLKNTLDWLVGRGECSGKPVALLNASSRGIYAQASLRETLSTIDARLQTEA